MPTNDTDYSCHTKAIVLSYLTNHMGSISHHIMPIVISSLGGGQTDRHTRTHARTHAHAHTHTHIHTHTHTHTHTHEHIPTFTDKAILRNQARRRPCLIIYTDGEVAI